MSRSSAVSFVGLAEVTALLGGFVSANLYQKLGGEKWAWTAGECASLSELLNMDPGEQEFVENRQEFIAVEWK